MKCITKDRSPMQSKKVSLVVVLKGRLAVAPKASLKVKLVAKPVKTP